MKIQYKDLSMPLRFIICGSWFILGMYAIAFFAGVIVGVMS